MKRMFILALVFSAGMFYTNQVVAAASNDNLAVVIDTPGDPAQKVIDKINQWTTLTQAQIDAILAMSANFTWEGPSVTPEAYRTNLKLLKQDIFQNVLTTTQVEAINLARQGG